MNKGYRYSNNSNRASTYSGIFT